METFAMKKEKRRSQNWGGARENAQQKIDLETEITCTMRIPKVFAPKLHKIAQEWDKAPILEFDIESNPNNNEYVSNSSDLELEKQTESNVGVLDSVTEPNQELSQAIDLACANFET